LQAPLPRWEDGRRELARSLGAGDTATTERLVKQFPWHVRDDLRSGLTAWGGADNAGGGPADPHAAAGHGRARGLAPAAGGAFWFNGARDVVKAAGQSDRARARQIAKGLVAYDRGRSELSRFALDSARVSLDHAYALLTAADNAAAHLVAYERARVSFQGHSP